MKILATVITFLSSFIGPTSALGEALNPAEMNRPALLSARAEQSTLLAVTRAGNNLVAAGERGIILVSDNEGRTWFQAKVPTSANLTALRFVDDKRGWAVGHMGIVLHTRDGGLTWHKQLDGNEAARLAEEVVAGSDNRREIKLAKYLVSDGPDKPFFDIWMDGQGKGFVVGAFNLMFRTDDGGQTWNYWSPKVENRFGLHLYSITKLNDDYFIAGEQGLLLRSTDDGSQFLALESPYEGSWFGILASNSGALLTFGLRGNAYVSNDMGENWQSVDTNSQVSFSAATELNDGRIILVNQSGQLFSSDDQGTSFIALQALPGVPFSSITQSTNGKLVLSSLRGMTQIEISPSANE